MFPSTENDYADENQPQYPHSEKGRFKRTPITNSILAEVFINTEPMDVEAKVVEHDGQDVVQLRRSDLPTIVQNLSTAFHELNIGLEEAKAASKAANSNAEEAKAEAKEAKAETNLWKLYAVLSEAWNLVLIMAAYEVKVNDGGFVNPKGIRKLHQTSRLWHQFSENTEELAKRGGILKDGKNAFVGLLESISNRTKYSVEDLKSVFRTCESFTGERHFEFHQLGITLDGLVSSLDESVDALNSCGLLSPERLRAAQVVSKYLHSLRIERHFKVSTLPPNVVKFHGRMDETVEAELDSSETRLSSIAKMVLALALPAKETSPEVERLQRTLKEALYNESGIVRTEYVAGQRSKNRDTSDVPEAGDACTATTSMSGVNSEGASSSGAGNRLQGEGRESSATGGLLEGHGDTAASIAAAPPAPAPAPAMPSLGMEAPSTSRTGTATLITDIDMPLLKNGILSMAKEDAYYMVVDKMRGDGSRKEVLEAYNMHVLGKGAQTDWKAFLVQVIGFSETKAQCIDV